MEGLGTGLPALQLLLLSCVCACMQVHKRREVLGLEEGDVEDKMSDEFLSYKVASVVFNQAIKAMPGIYIYTRSHSSVQL